MQVNFGSLGVFLKCLNKFTADNAATGTPKKSAVVILFAQTKFVILFATTIVVFVDFKSHVKLGM